MVLGKAAHKAAQSALVDELEAWFAKREIEHERVIGIVDELRDRLAGLK